MESYARALRLLLPRSVGDYWEDLDPVTAALFTACGREIARLTRFTESLIDESDPNTTDRLLERWERFYELSGAGKTAAERQAAVRRAVILSSGRVELRDWAATRGFDVTIRHPVHSTMRCGDPVGSSVAYLSMANVVEIHYGATMTQEEIAEAREEFEIIRRAHLHLHHYTQ